MLRFFEIVAAVWWGQLLADFSLFGISQVVIQRKKAKLKNAGQAVLDTYRDYLERIQDGDEGDKSS